MISLHLCKSLDFAMISTGGGEKPNDESFTHKFPMSASLNISITLLSEKCQSKMGKGKKGAKSMFSFRNPISSHPSTNITFSQ